MNCNYKVKITDIQNKYQFKILCKGGANSINVNDIYNLLPTTTTEGTDVSVANTSDIKAKAISIKGNTTQTTYTGKNLWGGFTLTRTSDGLTYVLNKDGSITISGTSTSANAVSMFVSDAVSNNIFITLPAGTYTVSGGGSNYQIQVYSTSATLLASTAVNETSNTFTLSEETDLFCRIIVPNSGTTLNTTIKIQLESGSSATSYEPYVGRTASPNPSYPQDVINVTGLNTINVSNSDSTITKAFTINLGSIELCKINTYQDYLYKQNNKWYKHAEVQKLTYKGTETWTTRSSGVGQLYETDVSGLYSTSSVTIGYSNQYIAEINLTNNNTFRVTNGNKLAIHNDTIGSLDNFKTSLSSNNLIIYYPLATPTITEITDTTLIKQLNNISNNIRTFEGGTNISSTSAGANPIINITTFNKLS